MRWRSGSSSRCRSGAWAVHRTLEDSDVFVGFLCLYLLTAARSPPFGDAVPMWEAAENLIRRGSLAIDTRWPVNAPTGRDGHYYPVAALLACLLHVPGALLQSALAWWAPERAPQFVVLTSQLGPIVVGALVPTLFFRLLKQLAFGRREAAWATLLLGAATPVWVYAHRPYSEILQAACFLAFFSALLRAGEAPGRGAWVRLGFLFGLLVNSKNVYFACLPGAMLFLFWRLAKGRGELRPRVGPTLAAVGIGVLPGLLALAWYNHARWGAVTSSGYGAVTEGFWGEHVLVGLWGQFLSPGKSVFLYAPPLLMSLWGLRRFWIRRRPAAVAAALVVGPVILLYARYLFWSGDWAWGPRYLVFALPIMLMPAAEVLAGSAANSADGGKPGKPGDRWRAWWRRAAVGGLLLTGVGVQCLGNAFSWDDFINISRQARDGWLGRPDTRGTVMAPHPCFSCFEEVYPIEWLPPMQPIAGHWWMLRHQVAGHDWKTAEADAPWRRYTSVAVDIEASYQAVAIDWWPLAADPGRRWPVALVALCLVLAIPLRPWGRALRGEPDEPDESEEPEPASYT